MAGTKNRTKSDNMDSRVCINAGLIYESLKARPKSSCPQLSADLAKHGAAVSARRVSDYLAMLQAHGYTSRLPLMAGRKGLWLVTRKAPPASWAEVFPPTKHGGANVRDKRDIPAGEGTCTLQLLMGLAPYQPPEDKGRVYRLPRDYDDEAERRAA